MITLTNLTNHSSLQNGKTQLSLCIFLRASGHNMDQDRKHTLVRVGYDGRVDWAPGGIYTVFCQVDTTFFPFDIQTCKIDFENWSFRGKDRFLCLFLKYLQTDTIRKNYLVIIVICTACSKPF